MAAIADRALFQNVVVASDWRRKGVATALSICRWCRPPLSVGIGGEPSMKRRSGCTSAVAFVSARASRCAKLTSCETAEPGAVVDDPEASDWRARRSAGDAGSSDSGKQQSGDPTGSDESTRAWTNGREAAGGESSGAECARGNRGGSTQAW